MGSLAREIGRALRRIRRERGLTLRDVAATSGGTFKATSVAGYERGERSITLERFVLLCQLYGTPAERVIYDIQRSYAGHPEPEPEIDLTALEALGTREGELLSGFVRQVSALRSERSGGTIKLRAGDIEVLATASGADPDEMVEALRPAIRDEA